MGASDNPSRYSFLALNRLLQHGHPVVGIGRKKLHVQGVTVENEQVPFTDVDTITLYLNPRHQEQYYDYILSLKPKRVIFNPGTENPELQNRLQKAGIPFMEACTLVMLSTGQY